MSRGHQIVIITGRLAEEPVIKAGQGGGLVAELKIPVTDVYRKRGSDETVEHTEWLRIKVFGRRAEIAQQYLSKGRVVTIEGRLHTEQWEDAATGKTRYSTWIYASELIMQAGREPPQDHERTRPEHRGRAAGSEMGVPTSADEAEGIDDIPF